MFKVKRLLGICILYLLGVLGLIVYAIITPVTTTTSTSTGIVSTHAVSSTPSQTTTTSSENFNDVNSASSTSANGLTLSLSLNSTIYQPGQDVSIVIDIKNTLSVENDVPVSDSWVYSDLGLGPCDNGPGGFGYPYGIAIFQENYTSSELPIATPLALYDYSVPPPCPGPMPSTAFDFKPLSDIATIISGSSSFPDSSVAVNTQLAEAGYWTGVSPETSKHDFAPGVYTIIDGDEWGALVVLHFTVSTETTDGNSATSLSNDGLRLSLSIDATTYQPGQQVTIVIDETNTQLKTNNVPASDKWPLNGLSVSSCGTLNFPFGMAVYQGYYTSGNISSGTPLKLYDPLAPYGCPAIFAAINAYAFQSSSDIAAIFQISNTNPVSTENMNAEVQTTGYWVGTSSAALTNFVPGVYTIVGGDEWGALVVVHFTVS